MSANAFLSVALLLVLAVVLVSAPGLRERYPRTWWYVVSYPMLWGRIRFTWRRLAWECELAVTRKRAQTLIGGLLVKGRELDPVVPRLWLGWPRPFSVTARATMLPGQTPEVFVDAAEAMAHAWRVHSVRVSSPARGEVEFTISARDPLADVAPSSALARKHHGRPWFRVSVTAEQVESPGAVAAAKLLRIPVGLREDGQPWVLDLRLLPHWLITGATQSGKSTLLNAAMVELATRDVALVGIDLKGGMELGHFTARLSALATDRPAAVQVLNYLVDVVLERTVQCRLAHVRSIWDLPEPIRPVPIVLLVDELAELCLATEPRAKADALACSTNLVRLAQLGASLGVHLLVAGQRVGSDLGPGVTMLRSQLGGRVCHRVTDAETVKMTLGDKSPDAVIAAQTIGPLERGVAITTTNEGGWIRARSANIGTEQARRITTDYTHCRVLLPGLSDTNLSGGDATCR
jgi:DNA segregation ATPase FtsK/SpoIIIE, S-DNA-T family